MQPTSNLYKSILESFNHWFECKLVIDGISYSETELYSVKTYNSLYSDDKPQVGSCVSGEIDIVMNNPVVTIPKGSEIVPYVRACDGSRQSEWIQKGKFYIDTREISRSDNQQEQLVIHGYDVMIKANNIYPSTNINYPALDTTILNIIATEMGVVVDSRTTAIMTNHYMLSNPGTYSMREVLGYIAASYGCNFVINDLGKLQLIKLADLPPTTSYLTDSSGFAIVFGSDRILV